jgi:hypothetical protein
MKKTLLFACLLSASCATVHCMDERQKLIEEHFKQKDAPPPLYQTAYVPKPTVASAPQLEADVEWNGSINANSRAARSPQADDIYNGKLYPAGTTTFGQVWEAQGIPAKERYRSGPLLDEYLEIRQAQQVGECCGHCWRNTCCCLCIAGGVAGFITGMVYLSRSLDSCDNNPYQTKCFPDLPDNTTLAFNVTELFKLKKE